MKKSRLSIHNICTRTSLLCIFIALCFVFSCSEQKEDPLPIMQEESDPLIEDEFADASARLGHFMKNYDGEAIELSGVMNYFTLALKGREVLQDHDNPCDVTLEILEGNNILVTVTEYPKYPDGTPMLDEDGNQQIRISPLIGKMTKGGTIKVSYPVPFIPGTDFKVTDIIQGHTGCELFGPGIQKGTLVFIGNFNGNRLKATANFMSKCEVEWEPNDLFDTPVDGPIKWKWSFDLTVDN